MERADGALGMAAYLHLAIAILVYVCLGIGAGNNHLHAGVFKAINVQAAVASSHNLEPAIVAHPAQVYIVLGAGKRGIAIAYKGIAAHRLHLAHGVNKAAIFCSLGTQIGAHKCDVGEILINALLYVEEISLYQFACAVAAVMYSAHALGTMAMSHELL